MEQLKNSELELEFECKRLKILCNALRCRRIYAVVSLDANASIYCSKILISAKIAQEFLVILRSLEPEDYVFVI